MRHRKLRSFKDTSKALANIDKTWLGWIYNVPFVFTVFGINILIVRATKSKFTEHLRPGD